MKTKLIRHLHPTRRSARLAMSLPEVLISLAITALLLTAVASAFSASSSAIEINDRFFRASQAARISLAQMCYIIRRSDTCAIQGWNGVSASATGTQLHMTYLDAVTGALQDVSFKFDATTNQLQLLNNATSVTYTLAHNISSVSFTADMVADPQSQNGTKTASNITIDITPSINNQTIHIRGSSQPRRLIVYK